MLCYDTVMTIYYEKKLTCNNINTHPVNEELKRLYFFFLWGDIYVF